MNLSILLGIGFLVIIGMTIFCLLSQKPMYEGMENNNSSEEATDNVEEDEDDVTDNGKYTAFDGDEDQEGGEVAVNEDDEHSSDVPSEENLVEKDELLPEEYKDEAIKFNNSVLCNNAGGEYFKDMNNIPEDERKFYLDIQMQTLDKPEFCGKDLRKRHEASTYQITNYIQNFLYGNDILNKKKEVEDIDKTLAPDDLNFIQKCVADKDGVVCPSNTYTL